MPNTFMFLPGFPDHNPRHWIGRTKKHSSHSVRQEGLRTEEGGLWAKRCGVKPINDREHQVHVFNYIRDHQKQGAKIWRFDRPLTPTDSIRGLHLMRSAFRYTHSTMHR